MADIGRSIWLEILCGRPQVQGEDSLCVSNRASRERSRETKKGSPYHLTQSRSVK